MKKHADRLDILEAGFISIPLQIGDLSLGHAELFTQLSLIQFHLLPE